MSNRLGILVVNRLELLRRSQRSGALSKRVAPLGITHEEVFRRYRGFDGLVWPELEHPQFSTVNGLANIDDAVLVNEYVAALPTSNECDVILLARLEVSDAGLWSKGWRPAGFDIGYFESEWSHFSVVLSEILYGTHLGLRRFASELNQYLLVPSLEQSLEVIKERGRVAVTGADFEIADHIEPIAIFVQSDA